jgi:cysteine-rich repeat protein
MDTPKPDYPPGETVIITGSGWEPGETVDLLIQGATNGDFYQYSAVADQNGSLIDQDFVTDADDVGVTFTLTATGESSGLAAQTTFTDGPACGNGNHQSSQGEQCDDHNNVDGDGCSSTCTIESGYACVDGGQSGNLSICTPICGDGLTVGSEQCDDGALNGTANSCCTATCTFKAAGTSCNDGDACTQTDTCQAGTCTGSNPVVCTALDQCHVAGTCDTGTGVCSNPTKADNSSCNDGNSCTQTDTCQAGTCTGSNPVVCTALDQCHVAGTCDTGTGVCSNPTKADNSSCNDGNSCTQTDTCQAGTCTGSNPVVCTALDQCHVAGTCDTGTGVCSNPTKADNSTCNDGNACTQTDTCQSGVCTGGSPVVCTASDQCHEAGTCNAATGVCSNPAKSDGATCSDNDACTVGDACQSGSCHSGAAKTCSASDECHVAGTCDPATGECSNPPAAEGTHCGDQTSSDCDDPNTCDGSGTCLDKHKADGTSCTADGTDCTKDQCLSGTCDHETLQACSVITDSSLCSFDVDPDTGDNQFRLIYTPDQNAPSAWKLNASNPGQYYYNIVHDGSAGDVTITLPYPFVTQGARPIHVYSDVVPVPVKNGTCFEPVAGSEISNDSTQVTLSNYSPQKLGSTTTVKVLNVPSGVSYINIHLDYGLKGTTNYAKDINNNAVQAGTSTVLIQDKQSYDFSDDSTPGQLDDTVQSENAFKKDPGIGGLVTLSGTNDPVPNVQIKIYDSSNKLLATVYTDQDGWYMWQYKYTGKAATFTVKLPAYNKSQSVTLKSNGFLVVNFTVS